MLQPSMTSSSYMKMVTFLVFFLWLTSRSPSSAKVYTRCQLFKELARFSFPRRDIGSWICIIENESGRSTSKVNLRSNGTNYGIFQINSVEWCKKGRKGGLCNVKCEDLTNEELSDDVRCAKRVHDKFGFAAWASYKTRCKGRTPPNVSGCSSS